MCAGDVLAARLVHTSVIHGRAASSDRHL